MAGYCNQCGHGYGHEYTTGHPTQDQQRCSARDAHHCACDLLADALQILEPYSEPTIINETRCASHVF